MSWRRFRNLLLLVLVAAVGYWIYKDRPSIPELVDDLTRPLLGSRAAVKEDERKRVISDAATVITQQTDENVGALHNGMTMSEVRDLLGAPDGIEHLSERDPVRVKWIYKTVKRTVIYENGRVVSIAIL
jgi:hypothetical protein